MRVCVFIAQERFLIGRHWLAFRFYPSDTPYETALIAGVVELGFVVVAGVGGGDAVPQPQ